MIRKAVSFLPFLLLAGCSPGEPPLTEQYPGDWQEESNDAIMQALTRNGVHDCEKVRYKQSATSPQEYRVRCRTGRTWQSYTVWTDSGQISRPYPTDPILD